MEKFLSVYIVLFFGFEVSGYLSGPPLWTCADMIPWHGSDEMKKQTSAPYSLTIDSTCYAPGGTYLVSLVSTGTTFRGFLAEAKIQNESYGSYGTFDANGDPRLLTMNCFWNNGAQDAIGHYSMHNDTVKDWTTKTFQWTAPNMTIDNLEFTVTVVSNFDVYWRGIKKEFPICGNYSKALPTEVAATSLMPDANWDPVTSSHKSFAAGDIAGNVTAPFSEDAAMPTRASLLGTELSDLRERNSGPATIIASTRLVTMSMAFIYLITSI